jgi:hypothetical protein
MRMMRFLGGGAAAAAMMVSSVSPAMAGWGGGFGGGYGNSWGGEHRHHDHDDAGAIIGAIAVVGVIAAIAAAASSSKTRTTQRYPSNDGYPERHDGDRQSSRGTINSENAAVDACAVAVEQRGGQTASVRDIRDVRQSRDGWDVEGTIEQRSGWRDRSPTRHPFTCSVRYGEVDSIYIDSNSLAYRD